MPEIESRFEKEQKSYSVQFDESHFGETKVAVGTLGLVGEMNVWWENICAENGWDENDKRWGNMNYYLMELGKNALEWGHGEREMQIFFEENKITVVVSDDGAGFEDPNNDIDIHPGHGLSEVKKFADGFIIETNGKKFSKIKGKRKLVKSEDTSVSRGIRITLTKNLKPK